MKICALCGKEVAVDKYFSRKSTCTKCGGDLHICLNCTFYSATSHNKCREPKAEFQRTREKANFCDYFSYREGGASSTGRDDAMRRLEDLFKK